MLQLVIPALHHRIVLLLSDELLQHRAVATVVPQTTAHPTPRLLPFFPLPVILLCTIRRLQRRYQINEKTVMQRLLRLMAPTHPHIRTQSLLRVELQQRQQQVRRVRRDGSRQLLQQRPALHSPPADPRPHRLVLHHRQILRFSAPPTHHLFRRDPKEAQRPVQLLRGAARLGVTRPAGLTRKSEEPWNISASVTPSDHMSTLLLYV